MSVYKSIDKVQLEVETKDETADIYVIDSSFRVVGRGRGTAHVFELKPGIYTVKVNVGLESREKDLVLVDKPEKVRFDAIEFSSAIPLSETAVTHEYQIGAAEQESQKIHIKKGKGSWIFIFARDWKPHNISATDAEKQFETTTLPHKGLKLMGKPKELIVDLESNKNVACDLSRDAWAACNIELDPGQYRLSVEIESGKSIEQTIVACRGWQTQVFLLQKNYGSAITMDTRRADLTNTGILMSRGELDKQNPDRLVNKTVRNNPKMFDAQNPKMRLLDLARLALTSGRQILPDDVIGKILGGKFENPMLGILGAYILLRDNKTKIGLLKQVVQNLRRILGEGTHPDVEALALRVENKTAKYDFDLPPMLRQSWMQVVNSTAHNPELIPGDSFACRNSGQMLGDEPWLLYMSENKDAAESVNESIRHLVESQFSAGAIPGYEAVRTPILENTTRGAEHSDEFASMKSQGETFEAAQEPSSASGEPAPSAMDDTTFAADDKGAALDDKTINNLVTSMGLPKAKVIELIDSLDL